MNVKARRRGVHRQACTPPTTYPYAMPRIIASRSDLRASLLTKPSNCTTTTQSATVVLMHCSPPVQRATHPPRCHKREQQHIQGLTPLQWLRLHHGHQYLGHHLQRLAEEAARRNNTQYQCLSHDRTPTNFRCAHATYGKFKKISSLKLVRIQNRSPMDDNGNSAACLHSVGSLGASSTLRVCGSLHSCHGHMP